MTTKKRIVFKHDEKDILPALGLDSPEEADAIANDTNHPDCYKMRFISSTLNGSVTSTLNLFASLLSDKPLDSRVSANIEKFFAAFDDARFKALDDRVMREQTAGEDHD